jgi:single-strand DNA-binding protein
MAVDGSIQTRSYEDKNGNKRKVVEVVVANVNFCGDGKKAEAAPEEPAEAPGEGIELGDDLPF